MRRRSGHKYNAVKVKADGLIFDSKAEWRHYEWLKLLERSGKIAGLVVHPRYPVVINGVKVCTVILDFEYTDDEGQVHTQDVKGMDTAISRLKRKLVAAWCGVNVEVIK